MLYNSLISRLNEDQRRVLFSDIYQTNLFMSHCGTVATKIWIAKEKKMQKLTSFHTGLSSPFTTSDFFWVPRNNRITINNNTFSFTKILDIKSLVLRRSGGRFKNTYELLNLRALKFSPVHKIHIFQCMGKIFCVEFQRVPLKFHTKYLTHTLKNVDFIQGWRFKSS